MKTSKASILMQILLALREQLLYRLPGTLGEKVAPTELHLLQDHLVLIETSDHSQKMADIHA
jgi:hypothetical protein